MANDVEREVSPLILEGFLLFTYPRIFEACTSRIFIKLTDAEILRRRQQRALSRPAAKRTPDDEMVERGFMANGIAEWRKFGAPQERLAGVMVLNGANPIEDLVQSVLGLIPMEN